MKANKKTMTLGNKIYWFGIALIVSYIAKCVYVAYGTQAFLAQHPFHL